MKYRNHARHFLTGFVAVWLLCALLGSFLGWNWPWNWQNSSHTLAKFLALTGGAFWLWVKRDDLENGE
jgi:hypothetical protein